MENPFRVEVYDKNFGFKGYVGNPIALTVTPRYNQIGTGLLVVDSDHHRVGDLLADGARVVIHLRGNFLMSGKVTLRKAEGPLVQGRLEFSIKDDFRLLSQVLGWPVSSAAITSQQGAEYAKFTGSAEYILKSVVQANMINRLGLPVTIGFNLDRGGVVPDGVSFRFHPLSERLFPALELAGIGVTFQQSGSSIVCDVFTPPVFAHVLSEKSGVITAWSWSSEDAGATRVVAGGQGEGTARVFRAVADTAMETQHREIFEAFRDARDAETDTVLVSRAQETLDENAPKSGFAVTLSESDHIQYGKNGLVVGAKVTVDLGYGVRTDTLREVTLSFSRTDGYTAQPVIGEISDNPDRTIAKFLARLKKGIADLKVSK